MHPSGERISLFGGLNIRALESNDKAAGEAEVATKVPVAMEGGGYTLHAAHSVSIRVEYATYRFFLERGMEIGTY